MMKKDKRAVFAGARIRSSVLCLMAVVSYSLHADVYDATTGFVTLKANDNNSTRSLSSAGNWSDGLSPHDDPPTNYYVGVNRTLMGPANSVTFAPPLFVAGTIRLCGGWNHVGTFNDLRILAGGMIRYHEFGTWAGQITFLSESTENPSIIDYTRTDSSYGVRLATTVVGSDKSQVRLCSTSNQKTWLSLESGCDWKEFQGTLRLDDGFGILVRYSGISTPGTFVAGDNAWMHIWQNRGCEFGNLYFGANSAVTNSAKINVAGVLSTGEGMFWLSDSSDSRLSTVGTFIIMDNSQFTFTKGNGNTEVFYVTNRLEIGSGVSMKYNVDSSASTGGTSVEFPIFRLSPEAVSSGVPDFTKTDISMNTFVGALPTYFVELRDDPDVPGGKYAYLTHKEVVHFCGAEQMTEANHSMDTDVNQSGVWSDGLWPHFDADYYIGEKAYLAFREATADHPNRITTFPGGKLCMDASSTILIYADTFISDLHTYSTANVHPRNDACHLSGNWTLHRHANFSKRTMAQMLTDVKFYVDSELSGDGDLVAQSYNPQKKGATLYLTALNTNWVGGVSTKWTKNSTSPEPSETSHTRIVVGDYRNLGGALPSFRYDSLTLSDYAELRVTNSTEFVEVSRGMLILTNGCVNVDEGKMVRFDAPLTLNGVLHKIGGGTMSLGGKLRFGLNDDLSDETAPESGFNKIMMKEGDVKIVDANALNGADIDFAVGTSLRMDLRPNDPEMQYKGFDFTNIKSSFSCVERVPVVFEGGEASDYLSGVTVPLCTVGSGSAEGLQSKLLPRIVVDGVMRNGTLHCVNNEDGTETIFARFAIKGFTISLR